MPEEYGGLGLDALTTARVVEALGRAGVDLGVSFAISAHLFATVMPIVEHGSGATLVVGIGAPESVLTYIEPDGTSFHSVGDTSRVGRLQFLCRNQVDEFMEEMAIPEETALSALFHFMAAGARPNNIQWEADW